MCTRRVENGLRSGELCPRLLVWFLWVALANGSAFVTDVRAAGQLASDATVAGAEERLSPLTLEVARGALQAGAQGDVATQLEGATDQLRQLAVDTPGKLSVISFVFGKGTSAHQILRQLPPELEVTFVEFRVPSSSDSSTYTIRFGFEHLQRYPGTSVERVQRAIGTLRYEMLHAAESMPAGRARAERTFATKEWLVYRVDVLGPLSAAVDVLSRLPIAGAVVASDEAAALIRESRDQRRQWSGGPQNPLESRRIPLPPELQAVDGKGSIRQPKAMEGKSGEDEK